MTGGFFVHCLLASLRGLSFTALHVAHTRFTPSLVTTLAAGGGPKARPPWGAARYAGSVCDAREEG